MWQNRNFCVECETCSAENNLPTVINFKRPLRFEDIEKQAVNSVQNLPIPLFQSLPVDYIN